MGAEYRPAFMKTAWHFLAHCSKIPHRFPAALNGCPFSSGAPFFPVGQAKRYNTLHFAGGKMVCQKGLRPFGIPRATAKSVATLDVCRHFLRFLSARRRQQNFSCFASHRHTANPDMLCFHIGSVVADYRVDIVPIISYDNYVTTRR